MWILTLNCYRNQHAERNVSEDRVAQVYVQLQRHIPQCPVTTLMPIQKTHPPPHLELHQDLHFQQIHLVLIHHLNVACPWKPGYFLHMQMCLFHLKGVRSQQDIYKKRGKKILFYFLSFRLASYIQYSRGSKSSLVFTKYLK